MRGHTTSGIGESTCNFVTDYTVFREGLSGNVVCSPAAVPSIKLSSRQAEHHLFCWMRLENRSGGEREDKGCTLIGLRAVIRSVVLYLEVLPAPPQAHHARDSGQSQWLFKQTGRLSLWRDSSSFVSSLSSQQNFTSMSSSLSSVLRTVRGGTAQGVTHPGGRAEGRTWIGPHSADGRRWSRSSETATTWDIQPRVQAARPSGHSWASCKLSSLVSTLRPR